jgi:hypothetical protein
MAVAQRQALRHLITHFVPLGQKEAASNAAMAIALGILGGCCGPNGDFSQTYRPPTQGSEP